MKGMLLYLFFAIVITSVQAQQVPADSSSFFKSFRFGTTSVKDVRINPAYTFKEITVLDNRPDTFHIGFFRTPFTKRKALSLEVGESLQYLFSSQLQTGNSVDKIFIVINHLNIQNIPSYQSIKSFAGKLSSYAGYISYSAKVYLQKDTLFVPLLRIDTSFISSKSVENAATDLLESVLTYTSKTTGEAIKNRIFEKRPAFRKTEVFSLNTPIRFQENISDTAAGLYLTFNDFIHNNLTRKNFRLELFKDSRRFLYVKQPDGSELLTRNVWGVSDGTQKYIMNLGFLSPLYKQGNAFYWYGYFEYKQISIPVPSKFSVGDFSVYGVTELGGGVGVAGTPYLLNMVTGNQF